MKKICATLFLVFCTASVGFGQTCTITGANVQTWDNILSPSCAEGGVAGSASIIVIPSGKTLNFNDAGDTWAGTKFMVYGVLQFTATLGVTVNASVVVKDGGIFRVNTDSNLGLTADCGYYVQIDEGGKVDLAAGKTLSICGTPILKSGPVCYTYQEGADLPYCEPNDGFTGPVGFDEEGINRNLPIILSSFDVEGANDRVVLRWTTVMEENFSTFIVQRSASGIDYQDIGEVAGKGFNIYDIESKYVFEDDAPLLGMNYYRLKAVDLDESFEYFQVKAVKVSGSKTIAVYPNPSTGDEISFSINFSPSESDRVVLFDQLGAPVYNAYASNLGSAISLPETLPAGIYILRYISDDFKQTIRISVK
jgi:hypothetical protein